MTDATEQGPMQRSSTQARMLVSIRGRVQGVGFRPTVCRMARRLHLAGHVRNTPSGVRLEIRGSRDRIAAFLDRLKNDPPRQARIDAIARRELPLQPGSPPGFEILPSRRLGRPVAGLPPDLSVCEDCLREIHDPRNRRYRYPFINCTNCGPRFTIIDSLPYDRTRTSMDAFRMCARCRAEYECVDDRRFDAQPNACPACGPALRFATRANDLETPDPLEETVRRLRRGEIVAVKGIGGYHLLCDAQNDDAIRILRRRKNRPHRALAVMFDSIDAIRREARLSRTERRWLTDPARPIVILRRRPGSGLSPRIAPDSGDLGAMLTYTPLHALVLSRTGPLVATSANRLDEPILADESGLGEILGSIADAALAHDRKIVRRADDTVLKCAPAGPVFYRRSRGFVPDPLRLREKGPPLLAVGGDLKNTFCLVRDDRAVMSQHIGDLKDYAAFRFFESQVRGLSRLLRIVPQAVACDLHPDYRSSRFAAETGIAPCFRVQHHHAHLAGCMAENALDGPAIGVILDGSGYGEDSVWGGEFLAGDALDFRRAARFKQYRLPGGENAIRFPGRMAFCLVLAETGSVPDRLLPRLVPGLSEQERRALETIVRRGIRAPLTSSCGRLFDAVSAMLGLCAEASYEAQAAVRLERISMAPLRGAYPFHVEREGNLPVLSFSAMIRRMVRDILDGIPPGTIGRRFHETLTRGIAETCRIVRKDTGLDRVVLSGGVFQNLLVLSRTRAHLKKLGFRVFSHTRVPPGDAGIALGQAAIARARLRAGRKE
jgi:hydrogenase maturation protein HypF